MAGTAQVGPAPSTLAKVTQDTGAMRTRLDQVASDIEGLANALVGPVEVPQTGQVLDPGAPTAVPIGSVNIIDGLVTGLSTPADRIEAALGRIRGAIG